MRRHGVSLALVAVLLVLLVPQPASAVPLPYTAPDCASPTTLPPQPLATGGAQEEIMRRAGKLAVFGRLDAAQRLYDLALTSTPPDPRAGRGLAYVQARRLAAENCVATAAQVRGQDPDAADAMLHQALQLDTGNEVARETLVTPATDDRTPAEESADRWDAFFADWVDPLVRLVVPALIALAVLLVLARALTSSVIRPRARAWRKGPRRVAWGVGFLLLAGGAVQGVWLATGWRRWWEGIDWQPFVVGLMLALPLILAAVVARYSLGPKNSSKRRDLTGWKSPSSAWTGPLVVTGVVAAALLVSAGLADPRVVPWLVTAAFAGLGLVLVAVGRGHALRLLVQVKKGSDEDAAGTAYVIARLQELGTSPPEGLKMPQQVDVQNLPTEALKSLPGGRVATALTSLLNVVLPATPWRAVIEKGDDETRVVVTVTRTGSVVRTALVDASRFLPTPTNSSKSSAEGDKKGSDAGKADTGDLLTAAAAVVLTELSRVHRELTKGLCGATRWESVAAHVVATKPPATAGGPDLRRELLAYAIQSDPRNALAQLAYANLRGKAASAADDLADYAAGLTALLVAIEQEARVVLPETGMPSEVELAETARLAVHEKVEADERARRANEPITAAAPEPTEDATTVVKLAKYAATMEARKQPTPDVRKAAAGYVPLRLRARHTLTAAWLNVAVQVTGSARTPAIRLAASNYGRLVTLLETASDARKPDEDVFLDEMSRVASALKRAFDPFLAGLSASGLPDPPRFCEDTSLESPYVLYDDSCLSAARNKSDEALASLERAAGLEDNRTDARTDPWFDLIRSLPDPGVASRAKTVRKFWDIVGPPPLSFTELPIFGKKGSDLAAVGVTSAAQLFDATANDEDRKDMAKVLEVPLGVVTSWCKFAELARPKELPGDWLTPRQLQVLHGSGIRSLEDLRRYVTSPTDSTPLNEPLKGKAEGLGVAPLDKDELDAVASRGGPAVSSGAAPGPPGGGVPSAAPPA